MAETNENKIVRQGQLKVVTTGVKNAIDAAVAAVPRYTLPKATDTTLGGVTVGDNITLTDGKISVALATNSVKGVASFSTGLKVAAGVVTLAAASASAIGGVVIGSNISVDANGKISVADAAADTKGVITEGRVSELAEEAANAVKMELLGGTELEPSLDTIKELQDFLKDNTVADGLVKQLAAKANVADVYSKTDADKTFAKASAVTTLTTTVGTKAAQSDLDALADRVEAVEGTTGALDYMTDAEATALVTEIFG